MPPLSRRVPRLALVTTLLAAPTAALAYGVWTHAIIPVAVLRDFKSTATVPNIRTEMVAGATDANTAQFRDWLYRRAAALPDSGVRNAFLRRYPTAAAFDAAAFKTFLMMNPAAQVLGVDSFEAVYRARSQGDAAADPTQPYTPGQRVTIASALQMGSVYPDLDRRNQDRLYRDGSGRVVLTADGDTVPMDPMTLNWGNLTGLSSQAAEHMGLNHQPHSSSPGTLTMAPWNFTVAIGFPTDSVESYAEANAEMYTDLSYVAMLSGLPGSQMLSYLYGGNALHYIADVGNQIHTTQAGVERIYTDATWDYWLGRLKTGFGLWGSTPPKTRIALDILTNYHTLAETLFEVELERAWRFDSLGQRDSISGSMRMVLEDLKAGDPTFKRVLDAVILRNAQRSWYPPVGSLIAATLIDSGFEESAQVYRLIRGLGVSRLHKTGVAVDFDTVPAARVWSYIGDTANPTVRAQLDTFNVIEGLGLARVRDATTWWWDRYLYYRATQPRYRSQLTDGLVARLVRDRLVYLAAADARRDEYVKAHGGLK